MVVAKLETSRGARAKMKWKGSIGGGSEDLGERDGHGYIICLTELHGLIDSFSSPPVTLIYPKELVSKDDTSLLVGILENSRGSSWRRHPCRRPRGGHLLRRSGIAERCMSLALAYTSWQQSQRILRSSTGRSAS